MSPPTTPPASPPCVSPLRVSRYEGHEFRVLTGRQTKKRKRKRYRERIWRPRPPLYGEVRVGGQWGGGSLILLRAREQTDRSSGGNGLHLRHAHGATLTVSGDTRERPDEKPRRLSG